MALRNTCANGADADAHSQDSALDKDVEGAKEVRNAFFPQETLSIPGLGFETFYRPAGSIGGDFYDFLSLRDHWESRLETYVARESVPPCSWLTS